MLMNARQFGHILLLSTRPIVQSRFVQAIEKYTLPPDLLTKAIHFAEARHALYFAGFAFSLLVLWALMRTRLPPLRTLPSTT